MEIGGYTEFGDWINGKMSPDGELFVSNEGAGKVFNQFDAIYEKVNKQLVLKLSFK